MPVIEALTPSIKYSSISDKMAKNQLENRTLATMENLYNYRFDPRFRAMVASDVPTLNQSTTGNAATVTTNANLTGPVTSIGNATAIANGAISNAMLANGAVANLSGTNTGDNATNSQYSGLVSNATHTGDAEGNFALTVKGINNTILSNLNTGILKNTTGTGVPSIAVAADFPILNQNTTGTAGSTATLATATFINK